MPEHHFFHRLIRIRQYPVPLIVCLMLTTVLASAALNQNQIDLNRKQLDRQALAELLPEGSFDNDPLADVVVLPENQNGNTWVQLDLLGLRRDRLAYIAKSAEEVVAVVVPATAEDGFNGHVDLLVAVDMFGRLQAVRVIEEINTPLLYGVLQIIESSWIKLFTGNTFRDIQRLSWQTITADNEYDLFVGASVTPKTVSAKIYDTLIFFQSNRIALIEAGKT